MSQYLINDNNFYLLMGKVLNINTKAFTCTNSYNFERESDSETDSGDDGYVVDKVETKDDVNATTSDRFSEINITCEFGSYTLEAHGDCCSKSWFEVFNEDNYEKWIGHTITIREVTQGANKKFSLSASKVQEWDSNYLYDIVCCETGEIFKLLLRNSSNGYYDGCINIINGVFNVPFLDATPKQSSAAKVIVLLGQSRTGKTTYINGIRNLPKYRSYKVRDDYLFLNNPSQLELDLQNGVNLILSDPRLVDMNAYTYKVKRSPHFTFLLTVLKKWLIDVESQTTFIHFTHAYEKGRLQYNKKWLTYSQVIENKVV